MWRGSSPLDREYNQSLFKREVSNTRDDDTENAIYGDA